MPRKTRAVEDLDPAQVNTFALDEGELKAWTLDGGKTWLVRDPRNLSGNPDRTYSEADVLALIGDGDNGAPSSDDGND